MPLLERAKIAKEQLKIIGPQLGKNFVVRHSSGDPSVGQEMVDKLLDAGRDESGRWMPLEIISPRGPSIAAFMERDKSVAQRRCRWHLTRIARALRAAKPDTTIEVSRSAQVVTHYWAELAGVRYDDATKSVTVEWHEAAMEAMGVVVATIREEYEKQVATAPAPRGRRG